MDLTRCCAAGHTTLHSALSPHLGDWGALEGTLSVLGALWQRRQRTVARAECPACACSVATRMLNAYHVGGDGVSVVSDKAGEVLRCCQCGTMYTVLMDGSVLRAKGLGGAPQVEHRRQAAVGGAGDRRGSGLDADLETLSADGFDL